MLGYRHGFHAGNFADVVKHSVLVMELGRFVLKDTPFLYFDTHGGRGIYDLNSEWAETGEAERGIKRLLSLSFSGDSSVWCADVGGYIGGRRDGAERFSI